MSTPPKRVVAVIPAYNEERFIGSVVLRAREYVDHVLVVDDGSRDNTANIAELAGAEVIRHEENRGKGIALNTAFDHARAHYMPAAVVTLDADWQHAPEELPIVLAPILADEADLVIGSRYLKPTGEVPWKRVVGHWGFNMLINTTSGTHLTDSQSGFRAFSEQALQYITFTSKGFSVESEMQFLATDYKLRVVEVPIRIRYEDGAKRSVITHGFKVLNGILRLIGQTRPLLFFTLPGSIILLIGLGVGLWVVNSYRLHQELAIGTALVAVLLTFIGTLALFTGIILHSLRGLMLDFIRTQGANYG